MGQHLKLAFLRAFAAFPGHIFIWKFDLTEEDAKLFAEMAPNVRPMKWLDQKSILRECGIGILPLAFQGGENKKNFMVRSTRI
jgi:hypothetical protein